MLESALLQGPGRAGRSVENALLVAHIAQFSSAGSDGVTFFHMAPAAVFGPQSFSTAAAGSKATLIGFSCVGSFEGDATPAVPDRSFSTVVESDVDNGKHGRSGAFRVEAESFQPGDGDGREQRFGRDTQDQ